MKAAQVSKPGGNFEIVERPIPEPGRAQVRIKVEACGVCHSDSLVKETGFPGITYPRVPGHEIAGRIDSVGADVTQWKPGQRVGVGWHGGHCFKCDPCRRGHFILCQFEKITGISYDGGYAEYVVVPAEAVTAMPTVASGQISVEREQFAGDAGVYASDLMTPAAEEYELAHRLRQRGTPILLVPALRALHDQAVEIAGYCRQQYKHGLGCGEAAAKQPELLGLPELARVIEANRPDGGSRFEIRIPIASRSS